MAGKYAELSHLYGELKDNMAEQIAHLWSNWNDQRSTKIEEWKELRNYIFATDTSTTSNNVLPWKNSTTRPKLCQIRDNLHSNYISSIFPNDNWLRWIGETAEDQRKAALIEAFMRDRAHQGHIRNVISQLIYDYIDYGNVFATTEYVSKRYTLPDGRKVKGFEGSIPVRISPMDIVFNPTAPDFESSPKIVRSIKTIGELIELAETDERWEEAVQKIKEIRNAAGAYGVEDTDKAIGFSVDGFGNLKEYFGGSYVEVLTFKGDYYDPETHEIYKNQEIIVVDRSFTVYQDNNSSWFGDQDIIHVAWRKRPDNLYGMGPLDNLVGMQYRIDHLENLKADAMDLLVHPPLKILGDVEPFDYGPNEEISIIGEGDVQELGKNAQGVLLAKDEIELLENKMEEMAGAPRQAMGIRTPGEKTAFEVQRLENAAGRIFQEKAVNFEINGLEPLLNLMFAENRSRLRSDISLRAFNSKVGFDTFISITPEDLVANGKIRPVGARHFAEQAQLVQNLTQLFNSPLGEMIRPHWSAKETATLIQDSMDLGRYNVVKKDIGLVEQAEQQESANMLNQVVAERDAAPQ